MKRNVFPQMMLIPVLLNPVIVATTSALVSEADVYTIEEMIGVLSIQLTVAVVVPVFPARSR